MATVSEEQIRSLLEYLYRPENVEIDDTETEPYDIALIDFIVSESKRQAELVAARATGFSLKTFPGGVDAATTDNQVLSGIRDLGTDRKVTGIDGLKVLVVGQTNAADNGLYLMKSGNWQRITGYTSGASLSGLMVGVNGGDNAGKFFLQADTLPNMQADKYFQPAIDLYESLSSLVSTSREETFYAFTPIITAEPEDDDSEGITQYSYPVGDIVGSSKIKRLIIQQSDYGDKTVKPTAWTYDASTGLLSVDASQVSLPEGGELMFELVSYGTMGLAGGLEIVINPDASSPNQLGYILGNGVYPGDVKPIRGSNLTIVSGVETYDTAAQAQAARAGNRGKITVIRGQSGSARIYIPTGIDEKLLSYTNP